MILGENISIPHSHKIGIDLVSGSMEFNHIVKAFAIFGDKMQSIELCVARFDEDTKASFLDLYTKIDAGVLTSEETDTESTEENAF